MWLPPAGRERRAHRLEGCGAASAVTVTPRRAPAGDCPGWLPGAWSGPGLLLDRGPPAASAAGAVGGIGGRVPPAATSWICVAVERLALEQRRRPAGRARRGARAMIRPRAARRRCRTPAQLRVRRARRCARRSRAAASPRCPRKISPLAIADGDRSRPLRSSPNCVTMRRGDALSPAGCPAPRPSSPSPARTPAPSATRPPYAIAEPRLGIDCLVYLCRLFLGQLGRDAQRAAARNDRHFVESGPAPGTLRAHEGVPRFVIGGEAPLFVGEHHGCFRSRPEHHLVLRVLEVRHCPRPRLLRRAASSAASLTTFASSAPDEPGRAAARCARGSRSAPAESCACARAGSARGPARRACPPRSGGRSGPAAAAPDRGRRAGWSRRCRMTPSFDSKPSISTSSWLSVCSRSSCPPPRPAPRWRPTASISSMKMMHGRVRLALLEQVAHARRADAHEHLDEVRARHREERHARLAGDGAWRAASCRCRAARSAARPWGCGRRGAGTSAGP